jgi:hypothetical protein
VGVGFMSLTESPDLATRAIGLALMGRTEVFQLFVGPMESDPRLLLRAYGTLDVLQFADVESHLRRRSDPGLRSAELPSSHSEFHLMRGTPSLMRLGFGLSKPRSPPARRRFSGTVEFIGSGVRRFEPETRCLALASPPFRLFATKARWSAASRS